MKKPIPTPMPADLPENWTDNQFVSPGGTEVGLSEKHGYNYQSKQINDAQKAINLLNDAFLNAYGKDNRDVANEDILLAPMNTAPATDLPTDYPKGVRVYLETIHGQFPNKPSEYGLIFSIRNNDEVSQLWFTQATGALYYRGGNHLGWASEWISLSNKSDVDALHTDVAELQDKTEYLCNPNLLDNWYFGNPVDQRGGYVVPPGVDYFALGVPDTAVGQTTAYTTVKRFQDGTPIIVVNSTEYAVVASNVVRGYTGAGYGIDRWKLINDTSTLLITNEGVKLIYDNSGWNLCQFLQGVLRKGITYTYSALYKASGNNIRLVCTWGNNKYFYNNLSPVTDEWSLATVTGTIPEDAVIDYEQIVIQLLGSGAGTIDIKAVKLELGSQQTLAHQDENGNWVLNDPPPDKNMELLKCCMSTADPNDTYANNNKTPASIGAVASTQGTATLPAAESWISNSAGGQRAYYVDIAIEPLTADNDIFIDRAYTVDKASDDAYAAAFSCVSTWVQSAGTLRAYAETPPESACPMNWTVIDG